MNADPLFVFLDAGQLGVLAYSPELIGPLMPLCDPL